ncbi:hypothetical protein CHS0354_012078 [Potamilus streckersoni]|uniref:Bee-milk protein n=1 Tax=Potamilus streckersoni TaxID=2493646 RepID=A0AAE0VSZ2_9BIVA|nr:hypothetical protein CHS0354_012078 [Potamilus streckersoni]
MSNTDGMRQTMRNVIFVLLTIYGCHSHEGHDHGNVTAEVLYEWLEVDYTWPNEMTRHKAIDERTFIPANNAIYGIRLFKNKSFVTTPRLKEGVPSTLNFLVQVASTTSVTGYDILLRPYPSWEMQKLGDCNALQLVQNVEIDPLQGYMYIVDIGHTFRNSNSGVKCPAKIIIYDIVNDKEVHRHIFPENVVRKDNNYLNDLVLDYVNGKASFLYITDTLDLKLVVYDIGRDSSYFFHHMESMAPVMQYSNVTIAHEVVRVITGINGIAISPNFTHVYYSAVAGISVYQIPTSVLRNSKGGVKFGDAVRQVGSKPSQGEGMIISKTGNMYFSALSENAIYKWDFSNDSITYGSEGNVKMDSVTLVISNEYMQWVDSLALDDTGYLWFTSSRFQRFFNPYYGHAYMESSYTVWRAFVFDKSYNDFRYVPTQARVVEDYANHVSNCIGNILLVIFVCLFSLSR